MLKNVLKNILRIQALDMNMLRLLKLKKERYKELGDIEKILNNLELQLKEKNYELDILNKEISIHETKIEDIKIKLKNLEKKQVEVKKVEEFNALTQEMSMAEKEKIATEQLTSDLVDKKNIEEELLEKIINTLDSTKKSSEDIRKEICANIELINAEGRELKGKRDKLIVTADQEIFSIYERLLKNKKDKVIVPIESRICGGCYIALTAQHENLVRKGERLVFCEHCSRILYWIDEAEQEGVTFKRRKRRRTTKI